MPPRKKPQPESKQGLVVTLVFFILATIGLGVATYYGFAEQATLEGKAKEADKKYKDMQAARDYYKTLAGLLRSYSGSPLQGDALQDLVVNKDKLDKATEKDKEEYLAVFTKLNQNYKLSWDPAKNSLNASLPDV